MVSKNIFKFKNLVFGSRPVFVLFLEVLVGLVSCVSLALLFLNLSLEVFDRDFMFYDTLIAQLVYLLRTPVLNSIMLFITSLGDNQLLFFLALIFLYFTWRQHKRESIFLLTTFITGIILNDFIKNLFHRPRPLISPLIVETNFSYPSGHAMNSMVFYSVLSYLIFRLIKNNFLRYFILVLCTVLILLIGFSRVYLGVHYPSDVLAGYIVGFWWLSLVILIDKTITLFRIFQKHTQ